MVKKLLLIFSFIALVTFASSGITYAWHTPAVENETLSIPNELHKLDMLYKEGVITEEEFSRAKSILLNSDSNQLKIEKKKKKKKKKNKKKKEKKKKLTAVERRDLKEAEENKLKEEREQLLAEKKAFREASAEEKERILEEKKKACLDDPNTKGCGLVKIKNILKKVEKKIKNN